MKLIIAGSTGIIGSRIVQQSTRFPEITSVVALSRKPIDLDPSWTKVKNVVVPDYGEYPDSVKAELKAADACIWTVGITPTKSLTMDFADVRRICLDYTNAGFNAMYEAGPAKPFRFIYFSGKGVPEDASKSPAPVIGNFINLRGEVDQLVRSFAARYDDVEAVVARPGLVTDTRTWARSAVHGLFGVANFLSFGASHNVTSEEAACSVLSAAIHGIKGQRLEHEDLVKLGREEIAKLQK